MDSLILNAPTRQTPALRAPDGKHWRIDAVGGIEVDAQGAVTKIHCALVPVCEEGDETS